MPLMVTGSPLWAPGVFHGRAPTCVQLRMQGSDTLRRQSGPVDRVLHFLDTVVEGAKKLVSKRNTAPPPKEASMADQVPVPLPSRHRPCESALLTTRLDRTPGAVPGLLHPRVQAAAGAHLEEAGVEFPQ